MKPRRPPSLPSFCLVDPGLPSFPHFERDPHGPIITTGQTQKSMPVGALQRLGLPGEDYEAKGAVQMAQDNFDCGLREDPPGRSISV
jgi:hypothetical protein